MFAAVLSLLEPLTQPYVLRGAVELVLLGIAGGVIGSWIVLRQLAFYTHSIGAATFPGLVAAVGLGLPLQLGGVVAAASGAGVLKLLMNRARLRADAATGLMLVAALTLGALLATNVFSLRTTVDTLLFGSVLSVSWLDLCLAFAGCATALFINWRFQRCWMVSSFEGREQSGRSSSVSSEYLLLVVITACIVIALNAVGALLITVIFVLPAVTARLVCNRIGKLQVVSVFIAVVQALVALVLAVHLDVSVGPLLAVLSTACFLGVFVAVRTRSLTAAVWS